MPRKNITKLIKITKQSCKVLFCEIISFFSACSRFSFQATIDKRQVSLFIFHCARFIYFYMEIAKNVLFYFILILIVPRQFFKSLENVTIITFKQTCTASTVQQYNNSERKILRETFCVSRELKKNVFQAENSCHASTIFGMF
jgi:hypothetical protein